MSSVLVAVALLAVAVVLGSMVMLYRLAAAVDAAKHRYLVAKFGAARSSSWWFRATSPVSFLQQDANDLVPEIQAARRAWISASVRLWVFVAALGALGFGLNFAR